MAAASRRSPASGTALLLAGLVVVGLALRLPSFNDSLFGDDLSTNYVVNGFGVGNIFDILASDQEGTPPLFFLLTWLTKSFGDTEGLRLVSLLAGLACIPLTYLLGARTVGRPAGLVGAALVALSPFQIFYASEARAYALMMLFCLLATLALLIAIESGRTRWWVAYALSVAAAAYTHYPSVFVLLVLFGWAFVARPQVRKPLVLANLGAALLFAPWIPEFIRDGDAPAAQVLEIFHPLTIHSAVSDLVHWAIGHPSIAPEVLPGNLALWLIGVGALVGAVGLVTRLRAEHFEGAWPPPAPIVLLVLLIVVPPDRRGAPQHHRPQRLLPAQPDRLLARAGGVDRGGADRRRGAAALRRNRPAARRLRDRGREDARRHLSATGLRGGRRLHRAQRRSGLAGRGPSPGDPGSPERPRGRDRSEGRGRAAGSRGADARVSHAGDAAEHAPRGSARAGPAADRAGRAERGADRPATRPGSRDQARSSW